MPSVKGNNHGQVAAGVGGLTSFDKNLITDQTLDGIIGLQNEDNWAFDAIEGYGRATAAANTTIVLLPVVAENGNMRVTATFELPTADSRTGLVIRLLNGDVTGSNEDFYFANVNSAFGNEAVIQKRVAGASLATVASGSANFPVTIGDVMRLTFTISGDQLTCAFENLTTPANDVTVGPVTDTDIAEGSPAMGGLSSGPTTLAAVWWRSVNVVQL
jgi:hypothetical protein